MLKPKYSKKIVDTSKVKEKSSWSMLQVSCMNITQIKCEQIKIGLVFWFAAQKQLILVSTVCS